MLNNNNYIIILTKQQRGRCAECNLCLMSTVRCKNMLRHSLAHRSIINTNCVSYALNYVPKRYFIFNIMHTCTTKMKRIRY